MGVGALNTLAAELEQSTGVLAVVMDVADCDAGVKLVEQAQHRIWTSYWRASRVFGGCGRVHADTFSHRISRHTDRGLQRRFLHVVAGCLVTGRALACDGVGGPIVTGSDWRL